MPNLNRIQMKAAIQEKTKFTPLPTLLASDIQASN